MRYTPRAAFAALLPFSSRWGLSVNSRDHLGIQIRPNFDDYFVVIRVWHAVTPASLRWNCRSVLSCTGAVSEHGGRINDTGGPRLQGVPRSQRVHVISPMNDLSIGDGNDRDEPIVIGRARSQDLAVDLVFNDHNSAVAGMINDKHLVRYPGPNAGGYYLTSLRGGSKVPGVCPSDFLNRAGVVHRNLMTARLFLSTNYLNFWWAVARKIASYP